MRFLGTLAALIATALASPATAHSVAATAAYSEADFDHIPKFDAHVHANVDKPIFDDVAKRDRFEILSINVDYPDFPGLAEQAAVTEKWRAADPTHFHYATTFSMKGFGTAGWTARTKAAIDAAIAKGAVAVKIWKNVGMLERDSAGHRIFLDDPRFDGVIRHLEARHIPLIAHQGEPKNCWLPLDRMTTENDRSYFREHPEYYMYIHPKEPSYEALMAHRDRFVARHPMLSFVGAHMGSLEWSTDRLARFLDRYPRATVDLAARMTQVQFQSNANRAKVRAFFIKYQDRLMYGTDLTHNPPDASARAQNPPATDDFAKEADMVWRSDWRYLATSLSQPVEALGNKPTKGLALPRFVIDKIYFANARRVFHLDAEPQAR